MTYTEGRALRDQDLDLAKVLLVDDNPTARLTLQAVLQAGGYFVETATSAEEALSLMERSQYALILTDLQRDTPEASLEVLAHARFLDYQPAIALVTSHATRLPDATTGWIGPAFSPSLVEPLTLVEPQDLPDLLAKVADLISQRAARLVADDLKTSR